MRPSPELWLPLGSKPPEADTPPAPEVVPGPEAIDDPEIFSMSDPVLEGVSIALDVISPTKDKLAKLTKLMTAIANHERGVEEYGRIPPEKRRRIIEPKSLSNGSLQRAVMENVVLDDSAEPGSHSALEELIHIREIFIRSVERTSPDGAPTPTYISKATGKPLKNEFVDAVLRKTAPEHWILSDEDRARYEAINRAVNLVPRDSTRPPYDPSDPSSLEKAREAARKNPTPAERARLESREMTSRLDSSEQRRALRVALTNPRKWKYLPDVVKEIRERPYQLKKRDAVPLRKDPEHPSVDARHLPLAEVFRIQSEWREKGGSALESNEIILASAKADAASRLKLSQDAVDLQSALRLEAKREKREAKRAAKDTTPTGEQHERYQEAYDQALIGQLINLSPEMQRLAEIAARKTSQPDFSLIETHLLRRAENTARQIASAATGFTPRPEVSGFAAANQEPEEIRREKVRSSGQRLAHEIEFNPDPKKPEKPEARRRRGRTADDSEVIEGFAEEDLEHFDSIMTEAIRSEAHRLKDESGVDRLPVEEFKEMSETVRDEMIDTILGPYAASEEKEALKKALFRYAKAKGRIPRSGRS